MAKKKLKLKKAGDGKNIRGGTFWGHRKSENDSELENAFEYVPVIGNLASVNDWMDATQNFAQNQNWNNFGKATLETAGLIPFGKAFTSGLKNGKLLNKANRAGLFLESALNYASDENAPSIFSSDKKIEKKGNGGDVKYPLITEGGYDIKRAIELGYEPDGEGHLPSRDYETGQYLKAKNYYTTPMSIINDELLGYKQRQDINGNLYSIPRDQQYPDFDLNNPPARTFKNGGKVNTDWEIVQDDIPIAGNGLELIPKPKYNEMMRKYNDSSSTAFYTHELNNAAAIAQRQGNEQPINNAMENMADELQNTQSIKPQSNKIVTVRGKQYTIPQYKEPSFNPSTKYSPQEGWWETISNGVKENFADPINRTLDRVDWIRNLNEPIDKLHDSFNKWHPFGDDTTVNVNNQPATVADKPQMSYTSTLTSIPKTVKIQPKIVTKQPVIEQKPQPKNPSINITNQMGQ